MVSAAAASYFAIQLRARTGIDDALDVFACHGIGGTVGALLTGVFATKAVNAAGGDGLLAGNPHQLVVQLLAIGATMVLAAGATGAILTVLQAVVKLRIPLADEIAGIDLAEHGEEAYHGGDIGELAGAHVALGDSVLMPTADVGSHVSVAGVRA